jgi:hypothetical protein
MLRKEDIEAIRRMTPEQRLKEWQSLVRFSIKFFKIPDEECGRRKWEAWEREHARGNANLLKLLLERDR